MEKNNLKICYFNFDNNDLDKFKNIIIFHYIYNNITIFPEIIFNYYNLKILNLSYNKLTCVNNFSKLVNLSELYLDYNKINNFDELCFLKKLKILSLTNNIINYIPSKISIMNLKYLFIENNYINNTDINLKKDFYISFFPQYSNKNVSLKFLKFLNKDLNKFKLNIYDDIDNIGNISIQQSFKNSLINIKILYEFLNDKENIENNIDNLPLNNIDILKKNMKDKTVLEYMNLTYLEIFEIVYNIIIKHKYKDELLKILDDDLYYSSCFCFNGKITSLVNCLSGFIESVKIQINENEQINNLITLLINKYDNYKDIIENFKKRMYEYNYNENIIDSYVYYLNDFYK